MNAKSLVVAIEETIKSRAECQAHSESDEFKQGLALLLDKHGLQGSYKSALMLNSVTRSFIEARTELIAGRMKTEAVRRILGD